MMARLEIGATLFGQGWAADASALPGPRAKWHNETRLLITGALWTPARLAIAGYLLNTACPHCGELDTLFHRLWRCSKPEIRQERLKCVTKEMVKREKKAPKLRAKGAETRHIG